MVDLAKQARELAERFDGYSTPWKVQVVEENQWAEVTIYAEGESDQALLELTDSDEDWSLDLATAVCEIHNDGPNLLRSLADELERLQGECERFKKFEALIRTNFTEIDKFLAQGKGTWLIEEQADRKAEKFGRFARGIVWLNDDDKSPAAINVRNGYLDEMAPVPEAKEEER